jgi:hypothetical protein
MSTPGKNMSERKLSKAEQFEAKIRSDNKLGSDACEALVEALGIAQEEMERDEAGKSCRVGFRGRHVTVRDDLVAVIVAKLRGPSK